MSNGRKHTKKGLTTVSVSFHLTILPQLVLNAQPIPDTRHTHVNGILNPIKVLP